MASRDNSKFSNIRKRIEEAIVLAEEDRKQKLKDHRLELARLGLIAFQNRQLTEAVQYFHSYLRVMEEVKSVMDGGLLPSCFDAKKELSDLLMISGVYWDLLKIYDLTKSQDKYREFLQYMEKYIIFSKGMPFQPLCAETMRKYIQNGKPYHLKEFRDAYQLLNMSKCFIVSSLIDVIEPDTLPRLQTWRDRHLSRSRVGRWIIGQYDWWSPGVAGKISRLPARVRGILGGFLNVLARVVRSGDS